MKLTSSVGAAQDAVSGFSGIEIDGEQAVLGVSNIAGMRTGARAANEILQDIAELVSAAKSRSDGVTVLASEIESRDHRDAGVLGA